MHRIQAQLTDEQRRRLKAISAEEGVSIAALLRRGADLVIAQRGGQTRDEQWRRALEVVGRFSDDWGTDVARRHDDYLDEIYGS